MSSIDKDDKSKVSKPSDKKFLLGFSDSSALPREKWMLAAFLSAAIRRKK